MKLLGSILHVKSLVWSCFMATWGGGEGGGRLIKLWLLSLYIRIKNHKMYMWWVAQLGTICTIYKKTWKHSSNTYFNRWRAAIFWSKLLVTILKRDRCDLKLGFLEVKLTILINFTLLAFKDKLMRVRHLLGDSYELRCYVFTFQKISMSLNLIHFRYPRPTFISYFL